MWSVLDDHVQRTCRIIIIIIINNILSSSPPSWTVAWVIMAETPTFSPTTLMLCQTSAVSLLQLLVFRPHRLHAEHRYGLLLQISHVAWSVCLCVCVCVLGTRVSCAKTAEPIQILFGGFTHVDQKNHVLDGSPDPRPEGTILTGYVPATV